MTDKRSRQSEEFLMRAPISMSSKSLHAQGLRWFGAAGKQETLSLMAALYSGGAKDLVEHMSETIRKRRADDLVLFQLRTLIWVNVHVVG
jgi:hypothetical protein